jgi:hypothetical protein
MRAANLIVVAAVALFAGSCSRKPRPRVESKPDAPPAAPAAPAVRPSVVGKWLTPTGGSIEFRANGEATMAGPKGSREMRYRLLDDRVIEIGSPGAPAGIRWQVVSLGAQELVIKDADGMEVRLRRGG